MIESFHPKEFDWDTHNIEKSRRKHGVRFTESEEVFFNEPVFVADVEESKVRHGEDRKILFGSSDDGRLLIVIFTLRGGKVRVISARDMNRKERRFFHAQNQKAG